MEDNNEQFKNEGNVSDALFGTSSDAIIEGLHQGVLTTQSLNDDVTEDNDGDKNQIVNEQDQNEITNAPEDDDYSNAASTTASVPSTNSTSPMSKAEANALLTENDHLDETGDSESGVVSRNSENDKIN